MSIPQRPSAWSIGGAPRGDDPRFARRRASQPVRPPPEQGHRAWSVVELRQSTLAEGRRDAPIALFDHLLERPDVRRIRVLGQSRDLNVHNRFVAAGHPDWLPDGLVEVPTELAPASRSFDR